MDILHNHFDEISILNDGFSSILGITIIRDSCELALFRKLVIEMLMMVININVCRQGLQASTLLSPAIMN